MGVVWVWVWVWCVGVGVVCGCVWVCVSVHVCVCVRVCMCPSVFLWWGGQDVSESPKEPVSYMRESANLKNQEVPT